MPARPPSPGQQQLLERIAAQRERLRAYRSRPRGVMDEKGPLPEQLWSFARRHPLVVALGLGAAVLAGPRRLVRGISVLLPLLLELRR
ncbi:MAG: hypothetical protein BGO13_10245 [Burkholderiales bacterium 66-5]|jgi:hypothetical protein|uniref:hypothetical protein n=1 Tax=Comamonas TaxID=283 RepID=UPI000406D324|nr:MULTISPECIES: hypothetical protein [Comamonas]ODS90871.1 MAG: hypothetical protein ABS45_14625 [Comamonas sp. SCN 65-56]OJU89545.1 MAG: hypothetical protein BGO13_10245 [Burkholderiales bacterium 66-5]